MEIMNHIIWNNTLSWIIDLVLLGDSNERLPGQLVKHFMYSDKWESTQTAIGKEISMYSSNKRKYLILENLGGFQSCSRFSRDQPRHCITQSSMLLAPACVTPAKKKKNSVGLQAADHTEQWPAVTSSPSLCEVTCEQCLMVFEAHVGRCGPRFQFVVHVDQTIYHSRSQWLIQHGNQYCVKYWPSMQHKKITRATFLQFRSWLI